jgi:hypothetical protein
MLLFLKLLLKFAGFDPLGNVSIGVNCLLVTAGAGGDA